MSIIFTETKDAVFGNLITMSNNIVEITATLDFGPRIIRFSLAGKENMFFEDFDKKPIIPKPNTELGMDNIHKVYGGHRLWISPEIEHLTYYPDDFPVKKEIDNCCDDKESVVLTLIAPIEQKVGIVKKITITMSPDSANVDVLHEIQNMNFWDIEIAQWPITIMKKGGKLIVPMAKNPTGYLPNRVISLWPYSDLTDERIHFGREYITVSHNSNIKEPFKFGINNEDGWAAYFNCGQLFIKQFTFLDSAIGSYPDNGVNYETYFNDNILEIETLGVLEVLKYKETSTHLETWSIHNMQSVVSNNPEEIKKLILPLLANSTTSKDENFCS